MALKAELGFGMMRLPVKNGNATDFDYDHLNRMVDAYLAGGYNYFNTSYVYHNGKSEEATRRAVVERHPRESFTVAGYIFFLNCEQAGRYRLMLLSGIDPAETAPMGIETYSDIPSLLANADLEGKKILVIPKAGSVVPVVTGE